MNTKQNDLIGQLKGVLQEIDMQCIEDEEFDNEIQSLNIFCRNINDIVEDMEHVDWYLSIHIYCGCFFMYNQFEMIKLWW